MRVSYFPCSEASERGMNIPREGNDYIMKSGHDPICHAGYSDIKWHSHLWEKGDSNVGSPGHISQ